MTTGKQEGTRERTRRDDQRVSCWFSGERGTKREDVEEGVGIGRTQEGARYGTFQLWLIAVRQPEK